MYIPYTFLLSDDLASLLVFQVLGVVALPVTISLAVEAFHARLGTRFVSLGSGNMLAILLRLPVLLSLPARFLKIDGLVNHQQCVLLLDVHLSSLEHHKHFRQGLSHALHVVVHDKIYVVMGQQLQHPINRLLIRNLAFQGVRALNVTRHFDHVLAHTAMLFHLG